jgi:hypothetical protein
MNHKINFHYNNKGYIVYSIIREETQNQRPVNIELQVGDIVEISEHRHHIRFPYSGHQSKHDCFTPCRGIIEYSEYDGMIVINIDNEWNKSVLLRRGFERDDRIFHHRPYITIKDFLVYNRYGIKKLGITPELLKETKDEDIV